MRSYRDGSSRSYARVNRERLGSEAAEQELKTKERRERQRNHMRKIRTWNNGHDEDDIAMDKKETKDERQQRLWDLQEDERIAELLEERQWGCDDSAQARLEEAATLAKTIGIETAAAREAERKRLHKQFKKCWAAFKQTDRGQILTANPDLSDHLKGMLEQIFK